jgi:hypothetical protein
MSKAPSKIRKAYVNSSHPLVCLRFEDGHEIKVYRNTVKTFDAYAGEVIKVLAVYDDTARERELLQSIRADELPDADTHESR